MKPLISTAFRAGLVVLFAAGAAVAHAGDDSFVIRAKAVYPATTEQPGPIENGMVIVRDGRIVAVGADLEVPADLPLIDLRDYYVCPGFVDAASSLTRWHAGPESVGGYRAVDAFNDYQDYRELLQRGTTTAHIDPGGHRLVTGLGAVVKLAGPPSDRVLAADSDVAINLGMFDPPHIETPPFYASSDVAIEPAVRQRPDSRLGQFLELEERAQDAPSLLERYQNGTETHFDMHARAFAQSWVAGTRLRVQARRAADIDHALEFIARHKRSAYLVGMTQADELVDALLSADLPIVLRLENTYDRPTFSLGDNPNALDSDLRTVGKLAAAHRSTGTKVVERVKTLRVALAGREYEDTDLRMVAVMARQGGMTTDRALAAVTRVPAEILGVDGRVGSLAAGKDADLLVLTRPPTEAESHVVHTYVAGHAVFDAPKTDSLVVRAGTIWVGDGSVLHDASLLIENGKIAAVGNRVPHPPYARVIDAGADGFVTPGFIDAHGHLGLERDTSAASSDVPIHKAIATTGREFLNVARSGVTSVMLTAYRAGANGARVAAIKTYGNGRDELVTRDIAGLMFSLAGEDPPLESEKIKQSLERGKKYAESWKKYSEELEKWKADKAAGKKTATKAEVVTSVEQGKVDPITGTWEYTISGGPLPEPATGDMRLRLTGMTIEGRLADPTGGGEEAVLTGRLEGDQVTLELDAETPVGKPTIIATLTPDHMAGEVKLGDMYSLDFSAERTDKSAVEFKVTRSKKKRKDGRPEPPKVDEGLEPYRPLLEGKVPALVDARSPAEVEAALKLFVDEYKIPVILLNANDAVDLGDELTKRKDNIGVVVPTGIVRSRDRKAYVEAADLNDRGIRIALQSNGEDSARNLPLMGLFAAREGLGGDAALRALTIDAARMFHIDDRVGSLEPGRDADVLIHSGYPFDAGSRLERVIVGGNEVPNDD